MIAGIKVLKRLKKGNERFVEGKLQNRIVDQFAREKMSSRQNPSAVILGCSDSRVPIEMVFDQGIGELFVIRVAGNIIAPSLVGSIEYAVEQFATPLVVVLGHSDCGAVTACVDAIEQQENIESPNLYSIIESIRPAIYTLVKESSKEDKDRLIQHSVRANICASVSNLRHRSAVLEKYISQEKLLIVGAEFDLRTGKIEFLTGLSNYTDLTSLTK